eukprot:scaffold3641_cov120-Cylindrotheca_fusiformis.AAC.5
MELHEIVLKVFESEQFVSNSESEPTLSIQLPNISFVHFAKFRSDHGNYHGGQLKIIGACNELQTEGSTLTIQMQVGVFGRFKPHLKSRIG